MQVISQLVLSFFFLTETDSTKKKKKKKKNERNKENKERSRPAE